MQRPRVQHVSIPRPPGHHAEARAFYGDVLGLEEIPIPKSIEHLDLIWFRLGDTEIHLFAQAQQDPPSGRHLCIEVDDVQAVRERLEAAGYVTEDTIPIPGRPRFFCLDPFNNRLEITTIEDDYLEAEKRA